MEAIIEPQAVQREVLYLIDQWKGQNSTAYYEEKFGDHRLYDFTVKLIPEGTTDLVQPLDRNFHRQLKCLVKKFCNYEALHRSTDDSLLVTRNGILKMHALSHFILSAPCFRPLIQYSWYKSGLWIGDEIPDFPRVSDLCFKHREFSCEEYDCVQSSFIKCSWCMKSFCFVHFFVDFHLNSCENPGFLSQFQD